MEQQLSTGVIDQQYELVQTRQRKAYRGELGIVESILQVVSEGGMAGRNATKIAMGSGLIHRDAMKKCQKLIEAGILESWREGRLSLFRITPRGLEFLAELRYVLDLARSANLRC